MSCYSGKCDLYDVLVMIHADGDSSKIDFSKIKIFAHDNDLIPLRIDCEKDLVPYYPYIEASGCGSDGYMIIHLSKESYVDIEERRQLEFYLESFKRYYRKCKRQKKEFYVEECLRKTTINPQDYHYELAERVSIKGLQANIDGIHMKYKDHYRNLLFEEMMRVGYSWDEAYRWCFGWKRWLDSIGDE